MLKTKKNSHISFSFKEQKQKNNKPGIGSFKIPGTWDVC